MARLAAFILIISTVAASAGQMVYQFNNPQFSGQGWDSHVLTIENLENTRKQALIQQQKSDAAAITAAQQNTNLAKFLNNLESRIYAQMSVQLANDMFSGGGTAGTLNFQGTTINWTKDTGLGQVTLNIIDPQGNATNIVVPIGSFQF